MSELSEFHRQFIVESREGLDQIDNDLVALEKDPTDAARLDHVLRILHSIKGNAGFLGFVRLGELAHAGETLFIRISNVGVSLSPEFADLLLRLMDALRRILLEIEKSGAEGADSYEPLRNDLRLMLESAESGATAHASGIEKADISALSDVLANESAENSSNPIGRPTTEEPTIALGRTRPPQVEKDPPAVALTFTVPDASGLSPPPTVPPLGRSSDDAELSSVTLSRSAIEPSVSRGPITASLVRVQVDLLDRLMNLVGELVLTRNRIVRLTAGWRDPEMLGPIQDLDGLTTELQEGVMKTRMQKIGAAWQQYPRIVRDLARQCGKQVSLELQGADTELDKSLIEAASAPLVHLVRNAVDHGIEKPYLRRLKGKPDIGKLVVRAFHQAGQVHIEVSDDGAGLDTEKIKRRAIERGMISSQTAEAMGERALRHSIFVAGFSTADKVSDISGRGIGLDVVKSNIEAVGGTIELETQPDVGTTFRLTVPLTLAIVPALIIRCGSQRFALPRIHVLELVRLDATDAAGAIERFHHTPVIRIRERLLPVAFLFAQLGVETPATAGNSPLNLLVVKTGSRQFALVVDEIEDAQEIVVKPLGELLQDIPFYSGAALMGDGGIALIVDVLAIARRAGLFASDQSLANEMPVAPREPQVCEEQMLVCEVGDGRRVAVPLADVVRLDEVNQVEHAMGCEVVSQPGGVVPVVRLADLLKAGQPVLSRTPQLVVCQSIEGSFGMIVNHVVDVAPRPANLQIPSRPGVVTATGVILDRLTDFLDVQQVASDADIHFFHAKTKIARSAMVVQS